MSVKVLGEPHDLKALPLPRITTFNVSKKSFWFGLDDGRILKYSCEDRSFSHDPTWKSVAECVTLRSTSSNDAVDVQRLFVDNKAFHCIACISSGDNWYSNFQGKEPIFLKSLKGVHIRSICFTDAATEDLTGTFLIGSQNGSIIEGKVNYRKGEYSFKPCCYLPGKEPVLDIRTVPIVYKECRTHVVIALSTRCLYEFFGGSSLDATLSNYSRRCGGALRYEVPLAGPTGELLVMERDDGSHDLFWCNATGVVFVNIPYRVEDEAASCFPHRPSVITYPSGPLRYVSPNQEGRLHQRKVLLHSPAAQIPRGIVVSKNVILLLFDCSLSLVSTIVGKQVATLALPEQRFGTVRCLAQDSITGETWLLTSNGVYQVVISDDSEDNWQHYLAQGHVERALKACKTQGQRDSVLLKPAYASYEQGLYSDAARLFGQVKGNNPDFETIALNFLQQNQEFAVMEYASLKLQQRRWPTYDPRFVIVTIWIIELLSYRYRDLCLTIEAGSVMAGADLEALKVKKEELKKQLFSTIASLSQVDDMTSSISFLLQTIMGCGVECVEFAKMRKDYNSVICYQISSGNTEGAFYELLKMPGGDKRENLLLRFSPLLFMNGPTLLYKNSVSDLDPGIMIPVLLMPLMTNNSRYLSHSINIVEKLFSDNRSSETYTNSMLMCCHMILLCNLETPDKLLKVMSSIPAEVANNDLAITLRYLKRKSDCNPTWTVPFIMLQSICGLTYEAVDMALAQGNLGLAAACANRPSDDFTKRRLWRRILQYYMVRDDVSLSSILDSSNSLLKATDVLQMMLPGVKMGQMQEIIHNSLQNYEDNVTYRRSEIARLCASIEETMLEAKMAEGRYAKLSANKECRICGNRLIGSSFIVYPCSHMFHRACVAGTLRRLLVGAELAELERLHNRFIKQGDQTSIRDYNNYLSRACLICGHQVEMLTTKPFISVGEADQIELWNIQ